MEFTHTTGERSPRDFNDDYFDRLTNELTTEDSAGNSILSDLANLQREISQVSDDEKNPDDDIKQAESQNPGTRRKDKPSTVADLQSQIKELERANQEKDATISDLKKRLEKAEVCQTGILRQIAFLSAALSKVESNQSEKSNSIRAKSPARAPKRAPQRGKSPRSGPKSPRAAPASSIPSPRVAAARKPATSPRSKSVSSLPTAPNRKSTPKSSSRYSKPRKSKSQSRPRAKSMDITRRTRSEVRRIKTRGKGDSARTKSSMRKSASPSSRSVSMRNRKSPSPTPKRSSLLRSSRSSSKEARQGGIPRPQMAMRPRIVPRPQLARNLDTSHVTKEEMKRHEQRKTNRRKLSEGSGLEPMFDPAEAARQSSINSSRKRKEAPPLVKKEPRKRRAAKASAAMEFIGDRLVEIQAGKQVYTCMVPEGVSEMEDSGGPEHKLELKQIYGYNGRDTKLRDNLIKVEDHLYYSVANVVVDYNLLTGTQSFFKGHTAMVTSVANQEGGPLIASGQFEGPTKKPKICIWNRLSMNIVAEIEGFHEGAVYHLSFSPCSNYLYSLSGDEVHTLIVFDIGNGTQVKPIITYGPVSKKDIFGLVLGVNHSDANGLIDELLIYGKKLVKSVDVFNNGKDQLGRQQYKVKASFVTVSSKSKDMELAYHTAVCFPFATRLFAVGGHSGTVYIISRKAVSQRLAAHKSAAVSITLCDKGFISASKTGNWKIWKYSRNKFTNTHSGNFSRIPHILGMGVPRAMQYDTGTAQLYVGSRKNQIYTMDLFTGKGEILMWGHSGSVCALVKHPKEPIFVTGSRDGHVSCWNSETWLPIMDKHAALDSGEKVNCAAFTSDGDILVCGTLSSKVLLIDFGSFEILQEVCIPPKDIAGDDGFPEEIKHVTCLRFNVQGNILAVGHGDCSIYLFSLNRDREFSQWEIVCNLTAPCNQIQFSKDSQYLKSVNAEGELTQWRLNMKDETGAACQDPLDPEEVEFAGDPVTIGWDVMGLQQQDGTITHCSKTLHCPQALIASGDSNGVLRLHKYPAMVNSSHDSYVGHAGEIGQVRWILDDTHLVSVGKADNCVFIWKLCDETII